MQPLTASPRDGLTEADVLMVLRDSPVIKAERGLEVLDLNLKLIEDISGDFEGGTVSRDCTAVIHGSCSLKLSRDVDYGRQFLRPYMRLITDDIDARFNCGVYQPTKPDSVFGTSVPSNQVSGLDRLALLNKPIGDSYATYPGDPYINAVLNVLATAGISRSDVLLDSSAVDATPPGPLSWPMLGSQDDTGQHPLDVTSTDTGPTTYLQVINELLAAINYRGIWVDWDGFYRLDPYIDPAVRAPEFTFDVDDNLRAIIARQRTRTRDISQVPNRWIFVQSNLTDTGGTPIQPAEGAGQYTVSNFNDGPTAINARGGNPIGILVRIVQVDAADQATLEAIGDQIAATDRANGTVFSVSSSPFPAAWHEDVYLYNDQEAEAFSMKVASSGWTLDFGDSSTPAANMTHRLLQVA